MENNLAENIRSFRKGMGFTQEQLAERLGITLAAVSKWERGTSEPDLAYIMDLAEIFHVSVDALIGFSMHSGDADTEAERLEGMTGEDISRIISEYETALKKFPNHFRIVLGAGESYAQAGIMYRQDDKLKRALELLPHALDLFSQNRDEEITEVGIRNDIAQCYGALKDYKKAIEQYKRDNIAGINNAKIGIMYKAFFSDFKDMVSAIGGYMAYYGQTKKYDEGLRTTEWAIRLMESMKKYPDRKSFLDKVLCLYHLDLAMMQDGCGMTEASEESLRRAAEMAVAFDRDPDYTLENMILLDHMKQKSVYDDAGATAVEGLLNALEECATSISREFWEKAEHIIKAAGQ